MSLPFAPLNVTFQSTLPRGSDRPVSWLPLGQSISIHAPSRERHYFLGLGGMGANFNPRSLAGATSQGFSPSAGLRDFNPRSLAGATALLIVVPARNEFQSTLPRGSDLLRSINSISASTFQSTLPRGSDRASGLVTPK